MDVAYETSLGFHSLIAQIPTLPMLTSYLPISSSCRTTTVATESDTTCTVTAVLVTDTVTEDDLSLLLRALRIRSWSSSFHYPHRHQLIPLPLAP
jgi:hypothetical protein